MTNALLRPVTRRLRHGGDAERGDIVLGWLVRVVLMLAVLGLFVFEGLSLVTANISGTDIANQVALEASDAYLNSHVGEKGRVKAAKMAAETAAAEHVAEVVEDSVRVDKNGTVTLKIRRTATTMVLYRSKYTADYAVVVSDGEARSVAQ